MGRKVYLFGVDSKRLRRLPASMWVGDVAQVDLAIVRAQAPYESEHPNYFFGARQHEGRLSYT